MAILKGIISKMNGSAGQLTFKQSGGQTVVSEKITSTTDAKTEAQQKQRMKWANVIRMYQVLQPYMKLAFGGSQNGRNDYNKFVSANLALVPVYLTKSEVNAGACIVAPYEITQGTIKSISVTGKGASAVTDIALGSLTIDADTTVAQFSNAVVQNNKLYEYGDQITYFLVHQDLNDVTNTPVADIDACCIVLDKNSDSKLLSLVDKRGFSTQNSKLSALSSNEFGNHGMAWIHSRKSSGKTLISAQFLIVENSILATYQSTDAYDAAVESYGGVNDVYLTPSGMLNPQAENNPNTPADTPNTPDTPAGGDTVMKTLSLSANPSEGGTVSGGGTYSVGSTPQISAIANAGYTFSQWNDGNVNATRTVTMDSDKSLVASFTLNTTPSGGDENGGTL